MLNRGIIVDAYSTGNKLAAQFARYGIECIHVQSMDEILPFDIDSFRQADFPVNIVHRGSIDNTVAQVQAFCPSFVLAGCESGVELADDLSERLGLLTNGTKKSSARRDKAMMQAALRDSGLKSIRTFATSQAADGIAWLSDLGIHHTVVKPVNSAGSDGVNFCYSRQEVQDAFDRLIGIENAMGAVNHTLLVQEKVEGQQFIVNTVSLRGRHLISDVWIDNRVEAYRACYVGDYEELITREHPHWMELQAYAFSVLDALEISNGPTHLEIMMSTDGPVLIEVGARMQGSICDAVVEKALGFSQVTLTALMYAKPEEFHRLLEGKTVAPIVPTFAVMLQSPVAGRVSLNFHPDFIRELPTYADDVGLPQPGDSVKRTVDMDTCPGIIYLQSPDRAALLADYQCIRSLEALIYEADVL